MVYVPLGFRYMDALRKGRPVHRRFDDFYIRHPFMDRGKRAKIFAPFDALAGFNEMILSKQTIYVKKEELSEDDSLKLDSRLDLLSRLIQNSNDARDRDIFITVTYFEPCTDISNEAYGSGGLYTEKSGRVMAVDTIFKILKVDSTKIDFGDIRSVDGKVFEEYGDNEAACHFSD